MVYPCLSPSEECFKFDEKTGDLIGLSQSGKNDKFKPRDSNANSGNSETQRLRNGLNPMLAGSQNLNYKK